MVQLLGLWGLWRCQVCRDMDCLHHRRYGPIGVFFQASCSWRSEGLFGQSFSIAPSIQALRRLPCLGSYPVVQRIRHIEGPPPWLGSYSVDQHVRHLKGHPGWGSYSVVQCVRCLMGLPSIVQLPMLVCRKRDTMVMAPPLTRDSAVSPCFHGCLAFLHQHFPPQSPPSHPLIHLSTVNSSPHLGITPQSLCS